MLLKSAFWIAGFFALEFAITLIQTLRLGGNEVLEGVRPQDAWWARVLAAIGASAFGVLLLVGFRSWLDTGDATNISMSYVILGLPSILLAASLISFFQVGLFGDAFPDAKREWLGRMAGYFVYFAAITGIVMFVAMQGTACIEWMFVTKHPTWVSTITKWVLPGGWIATTVGGLFAARSSHTGKDGKDTNNGAMEALASVAPSVFLFGLMLLLSWATYLLALQLHSGDYLAFSKHVTATATASAAKCSPITTSLPSQIEHLLHWFQTELSPPLLALLGLSVLSGGLACLLGLRVSVNEFSLHLFYRNRLVRTFLGASNIDARTNISTRRPDPFTGFTLDDDHYLGSLRQGKFDGPYPMWCTALNLTGGEDLAWQKRKASSFIYSPLFCGWDYMPTSTARIKGNAYREVAACTDVGESSGEGYGGKGGAPLIGTAMAASGAAVSPNWGYHTKPAVAALLAIFNVRIGWWAGNPLDPVGYKKYAPGIAYFLSELLGSANEEKEYVYLSDGGNFENLGLYELVRRRVKYIIVCDADSDPDYEFGDLANAIEKCRVDFGVQIEMNDYTKIAPDEKTRRSATHFAIGMIHYLPQTAAEEAQGTSPGVLLYIKSSITGDEPAQVLGQQSAGSRFPHDETLNQFFNETQFEAYRALGEHMGAFLETRYTQFLTGNGGTMPAPAGMAPEQRAEFVRMFFNSFLIKAGTDPSLLGTIVTPAKKES